MADLEEAFGCETSQHFLRAQKGFGGRGRNGVSEACVSRSNVGFLGFLTASLSFPSGLKIL